MCDAGRGGGPFANVIMFVSSSDCCVISIWDIVVGSKLGTEIV